MVYGPLWPLPAVLVVVLRVASTVTRTTTRMTKTTTAPRIVAVRRLRRSPMEKTSFVCVFHASSAAFVKMNATEYILEQNRLHWMSEQVYIGWRMETSSKIYNDDNI